MFRYIGVYCILAYLLAWVAYLELSPTMGNIWWRTTESGAKEFNPWGLWATAVAPFKRGHEMFWTPAFWDINPWPVLGLLSILGVVLHHVDTAILKPAQHQFPHADDKRSQ